MYCNIRRTYCIGYNTHKNYSAHDDFINNQCIAEMDVLRKIYWRNTSKKKWKRRRILRRTTLYISRSSNNGSSTNSAPCKMLTYDSIF